MPERQRLHTAVPQYIAYANSEFGERVGLALAPWRNKVTNVDDNIGFNERDHDSIPAALGHNLAPSNHGGSFRPR